MEIKKYKKLTNGRYKVFIGDNSIILYEDIILKYNLLKNNRLDQEKLDTILKENVKYEIYYKALN